MPTARLVEIPPELADVARKLGMNLVLYEGDQAIDDPETSGSALETLGQMLIVKRALRGRRRRKNFESEREMFDLDSAELFEVAAGLRAIALWLRNTILMPNPDLRGVPRRRQVKVRALMKQLVEAADYAELAARSDRNLVPD
jgi:hypothetical protein